MPTLLHTAVTSYLQTNTIPNNCHVIEAHQFPTSPLNFYSCDEGGKHQPLRATLEEVEWIYQTFAQSYQNTKYAALVYHASTTLMSRKEGVFDSNALSYEIGFGTTCTTEWRQKMQGRTKARFCFKIEIISL